MKIFFQEIRKYYEITVDRVFTNYLVVSTQKGYCYLLNFFSYETGGRQRDENVETGMHAIGNYQEKIFSNRI